MSRSAANLRGLLAWAHDDPGIVHLRDFGNDRTRCGKRALHLVKVSRRKVTCAECQRTVRDA